ncbi:MAG: hypothetical protein VB138_06180 [Burkholderia sp.]
MDSPFAKLGVSSEDLVAVAYGRPARRAGAERRLSATPRAGPAAAWLARANPDAVPRAH